MDTAFVLNETKITGDMSFDKRTSFIWSMSGSSAITFETVTSSVWNVVNPTASLTAGTTSFVCLTNSTTASVSGSLFLINVSSDGTNPFMQLDPGMSVQIPIYSNTTNIYTKLDSAGFTGSNCLVDVVRIQL